MKLTKVVKVKLIKPIDEKWEDAGAILHELSYHAYRMKNRVVQAAWEFHNMNLLHHSKTGEWLKDKDVLGKTLPGVTFTMLREEFPEWNTSVIDQVNSDALKRFNNDKLDIMKGIKSVPSFRKDGAVGIRARGIKLREEDGKIIVSLSIFSVDEAKKRKRKKRRLEFLIGTRNRGTKAIVDRLISGEYKLGACTLTNQKGKWMLGMSYTFESVEDKIPRTGGVMGIDLGITKAVYIAFSDSHKHYSIDGGEIERFRKQIEERRRKLWKAASYAGKGNTGHGRKKRLQAANKIGHKIKNFTDTTNHKYSRYIIDLAEKHNVERIQMEDLTGIRNSHKFLQNWTYYDLQQKIIYKAKEKGIEVLLINPQYTSQRCSHCGYIDKNNRSSQEKFHCTNCDHEMNADHNAAKNISLPNIESIIKDTIEFQEKGNLATV